MNRFDISVTEAAVASTGERDYQSDLGADRAYQSDTSPARAYQSDSSTERAYQSDDLISLSPAPAGRVVDADARSVGDVSPLAG